MRERWLVALLWGTATCATIAGATRLAGTSATTAAWLALVGLLITSSASAYASSRRRRLTPAVLARLAEGRLGLGQRFSTTLESSGTTSAVTAALHAETSSLARAAELRTVYPRRTPTRGLVALLVGVSFAAIGGAAPGAAAKLLETNRPLATEATDVPVERVLSLATSLDAEAADTSDPLLAALARALRELATDATRTADGIVTDRAALEDLLGTAARAMGSDLTGSQVATSLARGAASETASPDLRSPATVDGGLSFPPPGVDTPTSRADDDADLLDLLRAPASADGSSPSESQPTAGGVERSVTGAGDYLTGARQALTEQQSSPIDPSTTAAIIGASNESSAGDSQLAGQGSQALEGDSGLLPGADTADLVAVIGTERDDGRRIEMELAPNTDLARGTVGSFTVGEWLPSKEAAISVDDLPTRYRLIAGRYFLPPQDTRDTTVDLGR